MARYDTNQDGYLDSDEAPSWLMSRTYSKHHANKQNVVQKAKTLSKRECCLNLVISMLLLWALCYTYEVATFLLGI